MGRSCLTCAQAQHAHIDAEIVAGTSLAVVARRYKVSTDSLARHRDGGHISPAVVVSAASSASDALSATVERVEVLVTRLEGLMGVAEDRKALTGASNLARELRQCLELIAKLKGELVDRPAVNLSVNVLSSPELARLVSSLLVALSPFPEAKLAASKALSVIDVRELPR
jgi:hypothetical protein